MKADIHFWWHLLSPAARATLIDVGSKRLGFLWLEVFCAIAAFHAYRAPAGKRWAAVLGRWISEIRGGFVVIFTVVVAVFGYVLTIPFRTAPSW